MNKRIGNTVARWLALAGVTATCSACIVAEPLIGPDGKTGAAINCDYAGDITVCYKKAGEICGTRGYKIVDKKDSDPTFFQSAKHSMIVECK